MQLGYVHILGWTGVKHTLPAPMDPAIKNLLLSDQRVKLSITQLFVSAGSKLTKKLM